MNIATARIVEESALRELAGRGVRMRKIKTDGAAVAGALWLTMLLFVAGATPALADFHGYSVGYETAHRGQYQGVSVQRYDGSGWTLSLNYGYCDNTFSAPIVYETMWTIISDSPLSFYEFGTAHKNCGLYPNFDFWYAWVQDASGSVPIWTMSWGYGVGYDNHRFFLVRDGCACKWDWFIDSTFVKDYSHSPLGAYDSAGLESYDQSARVPLHNFSGMVWNNGNSWLNWSLTGWNATLPMEGGIYNAGNAWVAEN